MEAAVRVVRLESYLESRLDITDHAEKSDNASEVLSLLVEAKRVVEQALGFEVLCPPLEKLGVSLALHELLELVKVSGFTQHPWDLHSMSV